VGTRVLELYGSPFDSEADAGAMHQHTAHNYGWAGPAFVDRVMALHEKMINNGYDLLYNSLRSISDGKNMALVAETTVLALADAMIDSWFFADCDDGLETPIVSEQERILLADLQISFRSWSYAKRLAAYILRRVQAETIDVNEIATQYIADWILSNRQCFDKETSGSSYGFFADDNKTVYIFPSRIDDVLKKNGYNTMKTKHYLFEHGLIQGRVEKSGKRAFSVVKNYNGGSHRFLAFNLEKYISSQTEMDANYDVAQQTGSE
jgi:hypothetical protein